MFKKKESYLIPFSRFEWFEKGMKKITNKAIKLGIEDVPSFEILGNEVHEKRICSQLDDNNVCVKSEMQKINYKRVTISGTQPIVNGYEFVGTIEHKSAGNILKLREGLEDNLDLTPYRYGKQKCEHCGITRYRKDTYLVHNSEDNNIVQVGRTCLKDFMGHKSPEFFAKYAEFLIECQEIEEEKENYSFGKMDLAIPTREFLGVVYAIMIKDGGYKNKSHESSSTSSQAWAYYFQNTKGMKSEDVQRFISWCEEIKESSEIKENKVKASEAVDYYKTLENPNNFEHNLKVISSEKFIDMKNFGFGSYIMQGYFNFEELECNRKEKAKIEALKKDEYIGQLDKRMTFENMKYVKTSSYEHSYGTTYFHTFEDSEGRKMIVKNTYTVGSLVLQYNSELWENEFKGRDVLQDYSYTFKATVKKQEISSYSKRKETTVNRVKIEQIRELKAKYEGEK